MVNNHLSREIQEVYSREHKLPRNVIITDTVMIPVTKRLEEKWQNGKRRKDRPLKD